MAMSKRTATALEGSIKKWEAIVATVATGEEAEEHGNEDCPLCQLYHPASTGANWDKGCSRTCPIKKKTGHSYCNESPYENWDRYDQRLADAEAMLNFLIELRGPAACSTSS